MPGDSAWRSSATRVTPLEAVLSVLCALVQLPVQGLFMRTDRTLARTSGKPGAWTISRLLSTPSSLAAPMGSPGAAADHLSYRHAPSVESPDAGAVMDTDETRNTHQREPARNARGHSRGRPAR